MSYEQIVPIPIIQTRKGNNIPVERGTILTTAEVARTQRAMDAKWSDPSRIRVRKAPCGQYNCHGLTFLNRRGALLDPDAVKNVLDDDEYEQVDLRDVLPGDIAVYYDLGSATETIEHTGIVVDVKLGPPSAFSPPVIWVLSKWAYAAEYLHDSTYGEYANCSIRYWREGKNDRPTDF